MGVVEMAMLDLWGPFLFAIRSPWDFRLCVYQASRFALRSFRFTEYRTKMI